MRLGCIIFIVFDPLEVGVEFMRLNWTITLVGILCVFALLGQVAYAQEPTNYQVYSVVAGDTITSVADTMKVTESAILSFNDLTAGAVLKSGDILIIPTALEYAAKPKAPVQSAGTQPATITYQTGTATATAAGGMNRYGQVTPAPVNVPAMSPKSLDELVLDIEKVPTAGNVTCKVALCTNEKPLMYADPECSTVIWDKNTRGQKVQVSGKKGTAYAVMMADGSTAWMRKSDIRVTKEQITAIRVAPVAPVKIEVAGRGDLIATAKTYLGMPYKYGGNGKTNIDCSLFVKQVFAEHGITLPRTAHEQAEIGNYIEKEDLIAGDRLYFYERNNRGHIGHTGLYIGDGQFIHASSNQGEVAISNLFDRAYTSIYAWAKR